MIPRFQPLQVRGGKAQGEQMFSGLPYIRFGVTGQKMQKTTVTATL